MCKKGFKFSKEARKRMSEGHKGYKAGKETRKKMSESQKKHKVTKQTRNKISESQKGSKSIHWKGGDDKYWRNKLKETFKDCVLCKGKRKLEMHHKDKNRSNNERNNLIILCETCHRVWHKK